MAANPSPRPTSFNAVATAFMALDPGGIVRGLLRPVPAEKRSGVEAFLVDLGAWLRGWIVGTGVAMLFVGVGRPK